MESDEEAVSALVSARTQALVSGDADRMREILAPDFTYTNASGVSCDREEYVAAYVGAPDLVWLSQECSAERVRVYGEAAVVTLDVHDRGGLGRRAVRGPLQVLVPVRPTRGHVALRGRPDHLLRPGVSLTAAVVVMVS